MSYINKKLFAVTSTMLAGILYSICFAVFGVSPVSAVSASITTANSITLDARPTGNGVTIDEESIGITTTCNLGYDLNVSTTTSPNLYLNGNNTNPISFTTVNGTSALDNSNNTNKWGYTLTSNATSSTIFSPLSTTASALRTISGTTGTTNETFSIYYGVKVDNTVAPGSYSMGSNGTILYQLTMNPLCNVVDIAYDGNNADAGTMGAVGTGVIHTGVKDGDTVNLIASNFSRAGYGFAGWSVDPNAGTKLLDSDTTNNPVVYGPQETVTLPDGFTDLDTDNDGIVKLYAVWLQSQGNLQGWMGCNNLDTTTYDSTTGALDLTKNSVTALTDQRDNDTYAVARLADGECWMIENLRLDAEATRGNNQTDPTVTNEWLSQGYGRSPIYGSFIGLANTESANFDYGYFNPVAPNSVYYSGTQAGSSIIDIGTSNYPSNRMPRYNNINTQLRATNPTSNTFSNDISTGGLYSYGNYYTWHAAVADLTPNETNNYSTDSTSLCPAGWRLPTGGQGYPSGSTSGVNVTGDPSTYRDFYNLGYVIMGKVRTAYEDNVANGMAHYADSTNVAGDKAAIAIRRYPNNLVYSGSIGGNLVNYRGTEGDYWTSTAYSDNGSYYSDFSAQYFYPGTVHNLYKAYGRTIRCLASGPTNYTLSYDANGGYGAPSTQIINVSGGATHTISSSTPTRSGYTFAGWMDEKGNEVQAGGTFRTKDVNATLYAIWTNNSCNPTATTIGTGNASTDAVCLQDVKPSMKAGLPIANASSGTYNLIDARDGQSYMVAKLADGELWLTKNLNYGNNSDILLTSYDTDLPSGTTFKAPAITTNFETTDNDATRISPKVLTDSTYGGYYSFAAAIASTTAYSASDQNITTSICPKGWDLPTSTIYNNLRNISGNTTYAKMSAVPYSFIRGGYRNGTSFTNQTSDTRLWTSTNYNAQYAYYTTAYNTASYSSNYKRYGESVRCVASNGTATVNYNANGGTGTMAGQTGDINAMGTVKSNSFTAPANSQFRNWNTSADGTGTTITAGASLSSIVSNGDTITLYAQWDEIYYIAFNANGGSGTMTNQTVVRGTATNIKTSTFTRSGYIFYGWNTSPDGNGTSYGDEQRITNLTSTGNTITLYAVWAEGAYLDNGTTVNEKLKRLAGNSSAYYNTQDTTITAIIRSNSLPNGFTPTAENTISHSSSPTPIYAWYDSVNSTIYYYSEATNILMNSNSAYLFQEMRVLSDLSTISTWDTTKVTSMQSMFYSFGYNIATFALDLSSWNTSGVRNISSMFAYAGYNATTWSVVGFSSWDTSSVSNMGGMFSYAGYNATTWSVGNLSSWDTSNVTNMNVMFHYAGYKATTFTLNLSSWNTSSVTEMYHLFDSAGYSATTWSVGNLSSWNTSKVTNMERMFGSAGYSATTWSVGNLSSWNTSSVINMINMFENAGHSASTFTLDLSSWNTSSVTSMRGMFHSAGYSATTWSVGDLSSWNTSSVTSMRDMLDSAGYSATTWSVGDLSSWNTANVTNMQSMFSNAGRNATTWSVGDLSSWNTASVTNMSYMFDYAGYSATTWSIGDLSSWNTVNVTNMRNMFEYAGSSATTFTLNLSSWNTSSVTDMESTFYSAGSSATTWSIGDLSLWNTVSVKTMFQMFAYTGNSATTWSIGDLSSWNTSSVTNMQSMFYHAGYRATTWSVGNLSSWDTSSVTNMCQMFSYAGYFATTFTLNLSSWNTSSVTDMANMFSFTGRYATTWSVTISKTNDGTATGPIQNTTSSLYGKTTSTTAAPDSGRSFTLAN